MKIIFKVTFESLEAETPYGCDFEKYFLSFRKMKKFLEQQGFFISKGTRSITNGLRSIRIEKIEVE